MIDLEKRIESAMELYCNNKDAMHVPPRDMDIDVVLIDCLKEITELKQQINKEREQATEYYIDCEYLKAEINEIKKEEIKYKEKHGQLIGKIHALEKKLARYENPDYVLVPRNSNNHIEDIMNEIIWDKGGFQIHREFNKIVYEAMIEAVEKENE